MNVLPVFVYKNCSKTNCNNKEKLSNPSNNKQITSFGMISDAGRGGGCGGYGNNEGFSVKNCLLVTAILYGWPIWGPFWLGKKYLEHRRKNEQEKLAAEAKKLADDLAAKQKSGNKPPEQLLKEFLNISVIKSPDKGLNRVVGKDTVRFELLRDIICPVKLTMMGDWSYISTNSLPNGLIFFGPAGTGKTYMATAIGEHIEALGGRFVHIETDSFDPEGNVKKIREEFKKAEEIYKTAKGDDRPKYTVIFFDEMDSLVPNSNIDKQGKHTDEVNEMKKLTENSSQRGVIWIGATNKLRNIDTTILSRSTKCIPFGPVKSYELADILKYHIEKEKNIKADIDYEEVIKAIEKSKILYMPRDLFNVAGTALQKYKLYDRPLTTRIINEIIDGAKGTVTVDNLIDFENDIDFAKVQNIVPSNYCYDYE